jgi:hypothetical protein
MTANKINDWIIRKTNKREDNKNNDELKTAQMFKCLKINKNDVYSESYFFPKISINIPINHTFQREDPHVNNNNINEKTLMKALDWGTE